MADFITGNDLEQAVCSIIFKAKKELIIVSPFIKLDDYFKKEVFNRHKSNADLHILVAFGKNERSPQRSLSLSDFEYFKEFSNISIVYVPNLHAKFYANESRGVVTSLNLYDYSFKNNVEFGIVSETKLLDLTGESLDETARKTSKAILDDNFCVFIKRPKYKKKLILGRELVGAEVVLDLTEDLLKGKKLPQRSLSEFVDNDYLDADQPREMLSREEFEKTSVGFTPSENEKYLSGTALARTKGKRLSDVREVMAEKGFVVDNKITSKGQVAGLKLKYGKNGESWIVYPESMNIFL